MVRALGMIMITMRREERERDDQPDIQEVSHHSPGYGGPVVGGGPATQLVYEDEGVRGGVGEDGSGLLNIINSYSRPAQS